MDRMIEKPYKQKQVTFDLQKKVKNDINEDELTDKRDDVLKMEKSLDS